MKVDSILRPLYKQLRRDLEEYVNHRLETFEARLKGVMIEELKRIYSDIPNKETLAITVSKKVAKQMKDFMSKEFEKLQDKGENETKEAVTQKRKQYSR